VGGEVRKSFNNKIMSEEKLDVDLFIPILFYPGIARMFKSSHAAILLTCLVDSQEAKEQENKEKDVFEKAWITEHTKKLLEETCMSEQEFKKAKSILKKAGILEEAKMTCCISSSKKIDKFYTLLHINKEKLSNYIKSYTTT
jgi:2-phospho-L-lactate transferase/gluconeogenesis factor (CofD/UPF0052 family)